MYNIQLTLLSIGGSIRAPAANNGLFGLRPTSRRLPTTGAMGPRTGSGYIKEVFGPLSTSLGGIKTFMKTALDSKPWLRDPDLVPLPWNDQTNHFGGKEASTTKLKIAVMWDDGVVHPHPPVTRALRELVEKLKVVDGFEIVEWKPYKHDLAHELEVRQHPTLALITSFIYVKVLTLF